MTKPQEKQTGYIEQRESSNRLFGVAECDVDDALPLIEASSAGDSIALQDLLSQPEWAKVMLDSEWCITSEGRPVNKDVENDTRGVYVGWMDNMLRAMNRSAPRGHVELVKTLLNFGKEHGVEHLNYIRYYSVMRVMSGHHLDVMEAFIQAEPSVVTFHMGHGVQPLDHAVRYCLCDMADLLFRYGATVKHNGQHGYGSYRDGNYRVSLLSRAARSLRMTEILLEHGAAIRHSGALHTAAELGRLDVMQLLLECGADVNELLAETTPSAWYASWTPMHFAAHGKQIEAMKLLEASEASSDVKDDKGRTPSQFLAERQEEARKAEEAKADEARKADEQGVDGR